MDAQVLASYRQQLQPHFRGEVLDAQFDRDARSTDFGGMYRITPALVLRPISVADVQAALRFADEFDLTVSIRGMGHSQSGQGLGAGLLLDMTTMNRIVDLDAVGRAIEVEAGVSWRAVVDVTFAQGLLPVALTHALDTTVGGTLSVGGIGSAAWSYGPQVDNILYLDVVLPSGDLIRCSPEHEPELFDAVRAGLGQCGVIVRAGLPLRPCGKLLEIRTFVYRDLNDLLLDVEALAMTLDPGRLLAIRLGPDPLSATSLMAVLCIGRDISGDEENSGDELPRLHHGFEPPRQRFATWTADGVPGHPFFCVFAQPEPAAPDAPQKNPWVDLFYPLSAAPAALTALAANPDQVLRCGFATIIFVRRAPNPASLLVTPPSDLIMGLGMFPTFSARDTERAAQVMQGYAREMQACGGKRYLSGYFGPTGASDWIKHYGSAWSRFRAAKSQYDPAGRLGSNLVQWP